MRWTRFPNQKQRTKVLLLLPGCLKHGTAINNNSPHSPRPENKVGLVTRFEPHELHDRVDERRRGVAEVGTVLKEEENRGDVKAVYWKGYKNDSICIEQCNSLRYLRLNYFDF